MPTANKLHWKFKLGIFLFLVGQLFSIAHASEHVGHHEHNGVACLAILSDEQEELLPATYQIRCFFAASDSKKTGTIRQTSLKYLRSIRPPPTGPPLV